MFIGNLILSKGSEQVHDVIRLSWEDKLPFEFVMSRTKISVDGLSEEGYLLSIMNIVRLIVDICNLLGISINGKLSNLDPDRFYRTITVDSNFISTKEADLRSRGYGGKH